MARLPVCASPQMTIGYATWVSPTLRTPTTNQSGVANSPSAGRHTFSQVPAGV